jgi:hypothetical protein
LAALDTAAENWLLFSAAKVEPPKIRFLKTVGPFFFSVLSLLSQIHRRRSPHRPPACARRPPAAAPLCSPAGPPVTPSHRRRRAAASIGKFFAYFIFYFRRLLFSCRQN